MNHSLTFDTQGVLLLTAPLITGGGSETSETLSPAEYRDFAWRLHSTGQTPGALLGEQAREIIDRAAPPLSPERVTRLLDRGFQLAQAVQRWSQQGIWVLSRADEDYPVRLRRILKNDSPPILYGCGTRVLLDQGGLAVVGSRRADDDMLDLASEAGKLAASIGAATVSGGAKGVDSAAMSSALDAGGSAIGVLANNLQRACMQRDHRNWILDERLVLLSPYDPSAGFNVGHAMARNKLIYALSDAALVVNADYQKGGTWTGAVEHLNKHRAIPVFVRSGPPKSKALVALRQMGARAWPADLSKEKLRQFLSGQVDDEPVLGSTGYLFEGTPPATEPRVSGTTQVLPLSPPKLPLHVDKGVQHPNSATPEMRLLAHVRTLLLQLLRQPRTLDEISSRLGVIKKQAAAWLNVFIEEGAVVKSGRPARYTVRITDSNSSDKPT